MSEYLIEEWNARHPRWEELLRSVERTGQVEWFTAQYDWHRSSHALVALRDGTIAGFLRFATQVIGADAECEPVTLYGEPLVEAKSLAFAVLEPFHRQGIGRSLQLRAMARAAELGCYQLRSYSGGGHEANHQLKRAMGFGVHPVVRGDDRSGAYYIMPLRPFR